MVQKQKANAENKADTILDAAEKRMRTHGYNGVSFRDLASDTQIKSASVHYHFPRKEDLAVALVKRYERVFFEQLALRAANAKNAKARLKAICDVYRAALSAGEAHCLCGMLGAESAGLPVDVSNVVGEFFDANIAWVKTALGGVGTASYRDRFAVSAIASLQGAMMLATTLGSPKPLEKTIDSLLAQTP